MVKGGATTRDQVAAQLIGKPIEGVTGTLQFSSDGARVDPAILYTVAGERITVLPE